MIYGDLKGEYCTTSIANFLFYEKKKKYVFKDALEIITTSQSAIYSLGLSLVPWSNLDTEERHFVGANGLTKKKKKLD